MEYPIIEAEGYSMKVLGKNAAGPKRYNKDIMITWVVPSIEPGHNVEFIESMLSTEQAERLIQELNKRLEENANE